MSYEVATLAFQVHANYRTWSIDFAPPPLPPPHTNLKYKSFVRGRGGITLPMS